jgi:AraC-like DNA-binding protein
MTLACPPFRLPVQARILSATGAPLKAKQGQHARGKLIIWPAARLHAKPNPVLVFVLDGVADMDIGVTERMAEPHLDKPIHGLYRLRLPRQHVLIYPAYVPVGDGSQPHTSHDISGISQNSMLLWADILPEGAIIHVCRTTAGKHLVGPCTFILDYQVYGLANSIIEELQAPSLNDISQGIAQSHLRVLLLRSLRALAQNKDHNIPDRVIIAMAEGVREQKAHLTQSAFINRACDYIERHLDQPLSVAEIARQSFISPAHLNRAFQEKFNQPVMQYVKSLRLEKARSLLRQTNLPVNAIANYLGFQSAAYFCRSFRQETALTPLQYRQAAANSPEET